VSGATLKEKPNCMKIYGIVMYGIVKKMKMLENNEESTLS
jgi:hypothetical protein